MYQDILIPTDGSEASEAALQHGMEVASDVDATVHLLHVVDVDTEMSASASGMVAEELTESLTEDAQAALEEAEEMAEQAGVTFEQVVLEGFPDDAIEEYSAENGIDLIVIGESEDSTITERLFGGTTDDVLESTNTSVLVARN